MNPGAKVRAVEGHNDLVEGREYEVVEREGSFVIVKDEDGKEYGRGTKGGLKGKPCLAMYRFERVPR